MPATIILDYSDLYPFFKSSQYTVTGYSKCLTNDVNRQVASLFRLKHISRIEIGRVTFHPGSALTAPKLNQIGK